MEVKQGISTIFCEEHHLKMNSSFNAFQLNQIPVFSDTRKHIRLKKSMTLPDDTLEYWGFFLLRGATVELRACSRHEGSRILVVKGERNLRTCGLLEHNKNKVGAHFAKDQGEVIVTFETAAEVIDSGNKNKTNKNASKGDFDPNTGGEEIDDSDIPRGIRKRKHPKELHTNDLGSQSHDIEDTLATTSEPTPTLDSATHKIRHQKSKNLHQHHDDQGVSEQNLHTNDRRRKRDLVLNRAINHGGNAINYTEKPSDSVSSFENSLLTCYDGQILLAQYFPPSSDCYDVSFLANNTRIGNMLTKHEVVSDGFYYYIFYSDNDLYKNDIHAVFDIYKPTYEYANITQARSCINSTECKFPINMFSDDKVIVEVPTRDGIEHEDDDITTMLSICVPRSSVYLIFPILVLFFVLSCAFL